MSNDRSKGSKSAKRGNKGSKRDAGAAASPNASEESSSSAEVAASDSAASGEPEASEARAPHATSEPPPPTSDPSAGGEDSTPAASRGALAWIVPFLCFFLSGASGLVFEVIWSRKLSLVFGASTPAISTVLSAFMGGLALGSFVIGRRVDRLKFPVLVYAAMEAAVGLFALLVPVIIDYVYPPISRWISSHGGNSFDLFSLLRFFVVAVVLLPPTFFMGATLPLLTRHFVRQGGELGQRVGALYAVNTFGAVAGTFTAGFVLMPRVGLALTNGTAALTNVALAVMILLARKQLLGREWPSSWRELLPSREAPPESAEPAKVEAADDAPAATEIDEPSSPGLRRAVLLAAAGSGFAALAYEVILTRALDMVIGSSVYSFTTILMSFLVGIGGGSAVASALLRSRVRPGTAAVIGIVVTALAAVAYAVYGNRASLMVLTSCVILSVMAVLIAGTARRPALALGGVQLLIGVAAACVYYFQDKVPQMFTYLAMVATDSCDPSRPLAFSRHIGTVQLISFVVALMCALPPAVGMGATFPLAVRAYVRGVRNVGADTGRVYSVNTVGSIIGSFLTGFVLLPWVGMETAFYIAVAINLALALTLLLTAPGDEPAKYVLVPATAILLAIAGTGAVLGRDGRLARTQGRFAVFPKPWSQERMTLGVFRLSLADGMIRRRNNHCMEAEAGERETNLGGDNPIYYRDGVTTTVTVERWSLGTNTHFAMKNNGKVDASNGDDMPTQVLIAALPIMIHPRGPEGIDVAMVGWGSGITAGTALRFPINRLDVVELERATVDASRFFAEWNGHEYTLPEFPYVTAPRLGLYNNDGRNFLASTPRRYDVVISEPSNPWITGVSNMFTRDHFIAASRALAPGGIYLQWAQLYELSPNNIKSLLRTFTEVFPYVRVFSADAYSSDTMLLGSYTPIVLDPDHIDRYLETHPQSLEALRPSRATNASELMSRMLFATRDEVRQYTQIEEHREDGVWKVRLNANGGGACAAPNCRRIPAPINTDDNALIEFAAPRDLIGFDAFAGYVESLYTEDWPYGRVDPEVRMPEDPASRVRVLARLGAAMLGAGRPSRAGELIDQAIAVRDSNGNPVRTPELEHAGALWTAFTSNREPPLRLDSVRPGADVSTEGEQRLRNAFDRAVTAMREGSIRTALSAFSELPAAVREHGGPSVRMLYGYLVYKSSMRQGSEPRFAEAAEQLERLQREEPEWARAHPELSFFIGVARFHGGEFSTAVRAMSEFVDTVAQPTVREHEMPDVPRDIDEPAPELAPVTDEAGDVVKDLRRAG